MLALNNYITCKKISCHLTQTFCVKLTGTVNSQPWTCRILNHFKLSFCKIKLTLILPTYTESQHIVLTAKINYVEEFCLKLLAFGQQILFFFWYFGIIHFGMNYPTSIKSYWKKLSLSWSAKWEANHFPGTRLSVNFKAITSLFPKTSKKRTL